VLHLWLGLSGALAAAVGMAGAVKELAEAAARRATPQARRTHIDPARGVYDATTEAEDQVARARLAAHESGPALADVVAVHLAADRYYQCGYNQELGRALPEWVWRDFRLRLSHGSNHGTELRLERAALLWTIYHNLEPTQDLSERKRTYRHPGRAPLARAGLPPGDISSRCLCALTPRTSSAVRSAPALQRPMLLPLAPHDLRSANTAPCLTNSRRYRVCPSPLPLGAGF
jgi:hypothetical protein